ncbi:hypothetical protein MITS9509_02442 [Synechococcus sp. MIT S9509]|nr:hypothetical protein MITS9504_02261 [Synechococcus sp. MIT S9504]KZR91506.1 hypothetical protein MITS9509_02442 [Synechococcus sp. MIT S9509]
MAAKQDEAVMREAGVINQSGSPFAAVAAMNDAIVGSTLPAQFISSLVGLAWMNAGFPSTVPSVAWMRLVSRRKAEFDLF